MLKRLLIGIVKGLFIGGLLGFGLAKVGIAAPGAVVAYIAASVAGVLTGLVAGKPIWAKDAKVEAGMKALVGALLGAGLMYATRRWLTLGVPFDLGDLAAVNESLSELPGTAGTVGGLAVTSLAAVAALLGGFYEADNNPGGAADDEAKSGRNVRIADDDDDADADLEAEAEEEAVEPRKTRKR